MPEKTATNDGDFASFDEAKVDLENHAEYAEVSQGTMEWSALPESTRRILKRKAKHLLTLAAEEGSFERAEARELVARCTVMNSNDAEAFMNQVGADDGGDGE